MLNYKYIFAQGGSIMIKVYNAIYRTDTIYAEGYIVMYDDKTIEGIFALDYMYIYEYNGHLLCFLKTLSYFNQNKVLMQEKKYMNFIHLSKYYVHLKHILFLIIVVEVYL